MIPGKQPVKPVMTHFFYMDAADPSKVSRWVGSVGPNRVLGPSTDLQRAALPELVAEAATSGRCSWSGSVAPIAVSGGDDWSASALNLTVVAAMPGLAGFLIAHGAS